MSGLQRIAGFGSQWTAVDLEKLGTLAAECNYNTRALAQRMSISPRQLLCTFRKALRCSPRAWLRELRLQNAKRMLREASTVKQVAYALGFRQESQFCRDFKARFGHCPSAALPIRTLGTLLARSLAHNPRAQDLTNQEPE
ncbi:MAG: helix-turn-helix domain-containing protein [Deltaproteobacteria bacterium]